MFIVTTVYQSNEKKKKKFLPFEGFKSLKY